MMIVTILWYSYIRQKNSHIWGDSSYMGVSPFTEQVLARRLKSVQLLNML